MYVPGRPWQRHTDWIPSIVSALASQLDLNDVDSLSRTCRGIHDSLLQNRSILLKSSLHCSNEHLPVDPESTLRYRARAGNWYYMEDTSRSAQYNGKSGSCARDMVAQCRKCATIVCRVSELHMRQASPYLATLALTDTRAGTELCDKAPGSSRPSRQTSPPMSALPEVTHRLSGKTDPNRRPSAHLSHHAADGLHMRDERRRLALPALRSRYQRCRLRISRVRLLFRAGPGYPGLAKIRSD